MVPRPVRSSRSVTTVRGVRRARTTAIGASLNRRPLRAPWHIRRRIASRAPFPSVRPSRIGPAVRPRMPEASESGRRRPRPRWRRPLANPPWTRPPTTPPEMTGKRRRSRATRHETGRRRRLGRWARQAWRARALVGLRVRWTPVPAVAPHPDPQRVRVWPAARRTSWRVASRHPGPPGPRRLPVRPRPPLMTSLRALCRAGQPPHPQPLHPRPCRRPDLCRMDIRRRPGPDAVHRSARRARPAMRSPGRCGSRVDDTRHTRRSGRVSACRGCRG
jgi:hypothetical protein